MTIKKIAKLAGVSIGTVDRVIHGRGRVSKETEIKVNKLIKKYGYKPNIFASNLSLSKSFIFGVLMPNKDQDSNYWSIPANGINNAQKELSIYNIKTEYFYYDIHNESSFKNAWLKMINSNIDGLVFAPILTTLSKLYIEKGFQKNLPLVFFDSFIPKINCMSFIGQDSYQSGKVSGKLMRMLTQKNGSIAVIKVLPEDFHINQRANGFKDYFMDYNNFNIKIYNIFNSDDSNEFKITTDKIINENKDLLGIFVTNSSTHFIAKNIKTHSLKNKIHLIGYDLINKNVHYLKEGVIDFLISQKPEHQGYQSVYALYRSLVLKEKINKEIMMPIDIITKENIKYYIEQ
jgi:LacI family transcriptional regulator